MVFLQPSQIGHPQYNEIMSIQSRDGPHFYKAQPFVKVEQSIDEEANSGILLCADLCKL